LIFLIFCDSKGIANESKASSLLEGFAECSIPYAKVRKIVGMSKENGE